VRLIEASVAQKIAGNFGVNTQAVLVSFAVSAIGVAEAIEVSINLAQLVTVPILDSRLQEFRHEIKAEIHSLRLEFKTELSELNANLMRWVLLTMLGSTALSVAARSLLSLLSN
jgi:hypothetical protein